MAKTKGKPDIQVDGFYAREAVIKAPRGAPFGDIRLVIRRADNATNLRIQQTTARLLAYMDEQKRHVYVVEGGRRGVEPNTERHVHNFLTCAAQTPVAEGVPGFDDWDEVDLGMGNPRLLDAFDRWMALDGAISARWIQILNLVDMAPGYELDPKSFASPSGNGSGNGQP
jgi:hypothetical protein